MKKIKIMLLSLALFAVVGGALAFKAKFNTKFCTAAYVQGGSKPSTCPNLVVRSTTQGASQTYWTTTPIVVNQASTCIDAGGTAIGCDLTTSLIAE
jgi:hypothetical protein